MITVNWAKDSKKFAVVRSDKLYFTRWSRDMHRADSAVADTASGNVTVLVEERLNTYIETKSIHFVGNGREFVHWSERDGWGRFLFVRRQWHPEEADHVGRVRRRRRVSIDEKTRSMVLVAADDEDGPGCVACVRS